MKLLILLTILVALVAGLPPHVEKRYRCDEILPVQRAHIQSVIITNDDAITDRYFELNLIALFTTCPIVHIVNCKFHSATLHELLRNLLEVRELKIENSAIQDFNFSLLPTDTFLISLNLDNNPGLKLLGTSNADLFKFSAVNCSLTDITALLHYRDTLEDLDLRGNALPENDVCGQFPAMKECRVSSSSSSLRIWANILLLLSPVLLFFYGFRSPWIILLFTLSLTAAHTQKISPNHVNRILDETALEMIPTDIIDVDLTNKGIVFVDYSTFANFPNLTYLSLAKNGLTNIVILVPKLRLLDLSSNQLQSVTKNLFASCPSLEVLHLNNNKLLKLGLNLDFHQHLAHLDVSGNPLTSLVLASNSLKKLWMRNCPSSGITVKYSRLSAITDLELSGSIIGGINEMCQISQNPFTILYSSPRDPSLVLKKICSLKRMKSQIVKVEDQKAEDILPERVGCEYSTLWASPGDVIINKKEFQLFTWCFFALVALVLILCVVVFYLSLKFIGMGRRVPFVGREYD